MAGISINIRDEVSPAIARFSQIFGNTAPLLNVMGREAANALREHFRERDQNNPSFLGVAGSRRQHFWLAVMRSVQAPKVNPADASVTVSVNDPRYAQKVYGGVIQAKQAKYLTIPVDPEAYGRRTTVFEAETGLKLFFMRQRDALLLSTAGPGGSFQVRYILKRSVRQEPDEDAVPNLQVLGKRVIDRAEKFITRKLQGPGTQTT